MAASASSCHNLDSFYPPPSASCFLAPLRGSVYTSHPRDPLRDVFRLQISCHPERITLLLSLHRRCGIPRFFWPGSRLASPNAANVFGSVLWTTLHNNHWQEFEFVLQVAISKKFGYSFRTRGWQPTAHTEAAPIYYPGFCFRGLYPALIKTIADWLLALFAAHWHSILPNLEHLFLDRTGFPFLVIHWLAALLPGKRMKFHLTVVNLGRD